MIDYRMKVSSSVLSIFLLISAVTMTTVPAVGSKVGGSVGNGGNVLTVSWENNCEYLIDDYLDVLPSTSVEHCGGDCMANPACTYFSHVEGVCHMYNHPNGFPNINIKAPGWTCGYIYQRITLRR